MPYARRFAFTRRRTEGAGGFLGIDRMSKRPIGVGLVVIVGSERQRSVTSYPTQGSPPGAPGPTRQGQGKAREQGRPPG
jgi:hypothetical protein